MAKFVVAVRRDRKEAGLSAECIATMEGVTLLGHGNPDRVVVEAGEEAIDRARQFYREQLIIEQLIEHDKLAP